MISRIKSKFVPIATLEASFDKNLRHELSDTEMTNAMVTNFGRDEECTRKLNLSPDCFKLLPIQLHLSVEFESLMTLRLCTERRNLEWQFKNVGSKFHGVFYKWAIPGLFFNLFSVFFKHTVQCLRQINVKNVHSVYLWCWALNPRPSM